MISPIKAIAASMHFIIDAAIASHLITSVIYQSNLFSQYSKANNDVNQIFLSYPENGLSHDKSPHTLSLFYK